MYSNYSDVSSMLMIINIIIVVYSVITSWAIFKKAGEAGWAAIIPFYNMFVYYRVVWGNGWKMFFNLIPIYNIIFAFQTIFRTAKVFGKGTGFGFGLLFLNPIFMLILAFGDAQYIGAEGYRPMYYQQEYNPQQNYGSQNFTNQGYNQQNYNNQNYSGQNYNNQNFNQQNYNQQNYNGNNFRQNNNECKFCTNCGAKLDGNSQFCPNCGTKQN